MLTSDKRDYTGMCFMISDERERSLKSDHYRWSAISADELEFRCFTAAKIASLKRNQEDG